MQQGSRAQRTNTVIGLSLGLLGLLPLGACQGEIAAVPEADMPAVSATQGAPAAAIPPTTPAPASGATGPTASPSAPGPAPAAGTATSPSSSPTAPAAPTTPDSTATPAPAPTTPAPAPTNPAPAPTTPAPAPSTPAPASAATWWKPAVGTTWAWQLTDTLDMTRKVQAYDIDLFDTSATQVAALRNKGIRTICYISVGSVEDWRPDQATFPRDVIGKAYDGWPGENWLDVRQIDKLAPVMRARLDLCKAKGFDAIEPDNMDAYQADTGFPLTREHQIAYARWLATEAHARGLSIGVKNAPDLAPALEPHFDWALTESCFGQDDWCAEMSVFVAAGKPVFMTEYEGEVSDWSAACARAKQLRFSPILKRLDLDPWVQICP